MQLNIRVIPNASKDQVTDEGDTLKVRVTSHAERGKANKAVIRLLADYLGVRKSDIQIVRGEKSHDKVINVRE